MAVSDGLLLSGIIGDPAARWNHLTQARMYQIACTVRISLSPRSSGKAGNCDI